MLNHRFSLHEQALAESKTTLPSFAEHASKEGGRAAVQVTPARDVASETAHSRSAFSGPVAETAVAASSFERILPEGKSFEDQFSDFQRLIRELTTNQQRGDDEFLSMNVDFRTSYTSTLEDQGDLMLMLEGLYTLSSEMDQQIAEYQAFVEGFD